jgi:hypothetical protein
MGIRCDYSCYFDKDSKYSRLAFIKDPWFVLFLSLAILLCCLGAFELLTDKSWSRLEGGLTVDSTHKSFGALESGDTGVITYYLTNHTRDPVTILGATRSCYPLACPRAEDLPVVIPPRSVRPVRVKVLTSNEGDFLGLITLFTDRAGEMRLVLQVSGTVARTRSASFVE